MDITKLKIREMRKLLDSKEISAAELAESYIDRIDKYDGKLESYITVTKEKAMSDAENAQQLINSGKGISKSTLIRAKREKMKLEIEN